MKLFIAKYEAFQGLIYPPSCTPALRLLKHHNHHSVFCVPSKPVNPNRSFLSTYWQMSLVSRLEDVNPKKLKHEEKLAFWINVPNALVMHAVLAYGIPQNNMKRVFLLLKAAYNVGGHIVSADVIQNHSMGCRMYRPGQIRVYTPKRVIHELETAKEEFIRATFDIGKDQRILLPKVVENFAKDSGLCAAGVIEMIQLCLPDTVKKSINNNQIAKLRKKIEWAAHDFGFRCTLARNL